MHHIEFTLRSHALYSRLTLGVASVSLEDIDRSGAVQELWLPVFHGKSAKHVGNVLVSFQVVPISTS
jgi:hypothetical protein